MVIGVKVNFKPLHCFNFDTVKLHAEIFCKQLILTLIILGRYLNYNKNYTALLLLFSSGLLSTDLLLSLAGDFSLRLRLLLSGDLFLTLSGDLLLPLSGDQILFLSGDLLPLSGNILLSLSGDHLLPLSGDLLGDLHLPLLGEFSFDRLQLLSGVLLLLLCFGDLIPMKDLVQ